MEALSSETGAVPKVTISVDIGSFLKDLVELDLDEAKKNPDHTAHGDELITKRPLSVGEDSTKKFLECVDKIQIGVNSLTEYVKRNQVRADQFMAGIPKPESLKEFDDPVASLEYAYTNLEDFEPTLGHVTAGLERSEKMLTHLPRLKDNLDPMQIVTKVAPEQFGNLTESLAALISKSEVLKADLATVAARLTSCREKLTGVVKTLAPSAENQVAKENNATEESKTAEESKVTEGSKVAEENKAVEEHKALEEHPVINSPAAPDAAASTSTASIETEAALADVKEPVAVMPNGET